MDIDLLRTFCQLADDKNFRVASQHLYITQSALTKKIQRLEEQLKVSLFDRGRHGAELTPMGKVLLPEAKRVLKGFESFQRLATFVAEGTSGHLNIGFGISSFHEAPNYIAKFKQSYPNVNVNLNDFPSHKLVEELKMGNLQLGFDRLPVEAPLTAIPLFSDRLAVAIHEDESVNLKNLWGSLSHHNYLGLSRNKNPTINKHITTYLWEEKQRPAVIEEANDIITVLALVSARLGYTIVPASVSRISQPQIRFIPLNGLHAEWSVGLIWNSDISDPIRKAFINKVEGIHETFKSI
ncbi:LysR family transcriptional regulator [Vibrio vulnificus]|nr:LysR family transcriptional regulator [Vibrio vulnificus]EKO5187351.1 LysR family transcriptional regulator [Vibrio vulnificus]ELH7804221.1 LysR family transcriptional regulator [Vibrio vulnificus]MCU8259412.1 LysR family transcriptional regulator [Vibrio vulnificus]MCU8421784.1 LysR family transcriptional regulator [Vibrio vulnificus]